MTKEKAAAQEIRFLIGYIYMLYYCPRKQVKTFKKASEPMLTALAKRSGQAFRTYLKNAVPHACRHIIAFHKNIRQVRKKEIDQLAESVLKTSRHGEFIKQMTDLIQNPARAKINNRIRPNKGCQFCQFPCGYGLFVLSTKPNFKILERFLQDEQNKKKKEQEAFSSVWAFAVAHLWHSLGIREHFISKEHLGNLAYCLLTIAEEKSRRRFPSKEFKAFQEMNQKLIQAES
jgi:hypothetical protein